jgi:dTDP-4-dehydrorhamnose reductase
MCQESVTNGLYRLCEVVFSCGLREHFCALSVGPLSLGSCPDLVGMVFLQVHIGEGEPLHAFSPQAVYETTQAFSVVEFRTCVSLPFDQLLFSLLRKKSPSSSSSSSVFLSLSPSLSTTMDGPRVLILGGIGFVGRNFVAYLAKNKLASKITVADKVLPATANLNDEEKAIFQSDLVSFKQANLAREATIDKVFEHDGGNYEYVFNLAASTKYSQVDEVYKENIIDLSRICAAAAKKHGAKRFIEVSTAQVYDSGKKASVESSKLKPWTLIAKASLEAEKAVAAAGVNHVIVRPAIIYGKVGFRVVQAPLHRHRHQRFQKTTSQAQEHANHIAIVSCCFRPQDTPCTSYTPKHTHTHTHTHRHRHTHTRTHTSTHQHKHTHTYTYTRTHTHTNIYTYPQKNARTHLHVYAYTHIHLCTYTYMHTHAPLWYSHSHLFLVLLRRLLCSVV